MSEQTRSSSWLVKGLVVIVGIALMLVAIGVLQVNPGQIRSSRPVLFATGLVITLVGVLAFLRTRLAEGTRAFQIGVGVTVAAAAVLVVLVAINSHDETLAIGPFVFRGPAVDAFGKVYLGLDSLLLAAGAVWLLSRAAGRRGAVDSRGAGRREDA